MRIVSWNIAGRNEPWRVLADMDVDLALLQEAQEPPPDVAGRVEVDPAPWEITGGYATPQRWRAAIAKFSDRVGVQWIHSKPLPDATPSEFAVSLPGSLAAAKVTPPGADPIILLSMYSQWRYPHEMTGSRYIMSDSSAHRIISDLSELIGRQSAHRIIAAGDLNILYGYGEYGSPYWAERYRSIFTRMEALGLKFCGPQAPHGRQADPWPEELPKDSLNVPTYHSSQQLPMSATRQLDFVFASRGLADKVQVRALNTPDDWGPSDHCRLDIQVL